MTRMATSDAQVEYAAARRGAGLIDRREHGMLEATGRDRATFLNALLSNDVKSLAPGLGCAATLLDVHGKVQVVLLVWVLDDRILIVTPPGTAASTLEALDKYLFSEKVDLRDASEDWALLMLTGPEAPPLVERLAGAVPDARPWSHLPGRIDGIDVRLVRGGGETGEPEIWIAAPVAAAEHVSKALTAAGAIVLGPEALESLRIEAGAPRFPADIGPAVLLPEVPFETLVSYTKGCYPGQEVVVRIRDRGHVNRHLRGLVLEGDVVPPAGSEVVAGDAVIGAVTSATRSFGLDRPIALAMVRRQHAEPGTAVGVRVGDRVVPAIVSALPFTR
jgi:folate-binding protein YgfZ